MKEINKEQPFGLTEWLEHFLPLISSTGFWYLVAPSSISKSKPMEASKQSINRSLTSVWQIPSSPSDTENGPWYYTPVDNDAWYRMLRLT